MEHDGSSSGDSSSVLENASLAKIMATAAGLGVIHILTGPDHLSALAALSSGRSWRAFALGVQWGCGHSLGIVSVAVVCLAVGHAVNLGAVRVVCNYVAGVLLVAIGVWTLHHAKRELDAHSKPASKWSAVECQDASYTLLRAEDAKSGGVLGGGSCWVNSQSEHGSGTAQTLASVLVGLVHGIAGPGGVLGVLPVLAMRRTLHAVAYLGCFCASSILCMGVFAALYGQFTQWCASRSASTTTTATAAARTSGARMTTTRASDAESDDASCVVVASANANACASALITFRIAVVSSLLSIIVGVVWIVLQACGVLDEVFGHDHKHH